MLLNVTCVFNTDDNRIINNNNSAQTKWSENIILSVFLLVGLPPPPPPPSYGQTTAPQGPHMPSGKFDYGYENIILRMDFLS